MLGELVLQRLSPDGCDIGGWIGDFLFEVLHYPPEVLGLTHR